jgi:hypothetical protein
MTLDIYGHVFDELEDAEPVTAEELIREARAKHDGCVPGATPQPERQQNGKQNPAGRGF